MHVEAFRNVDYCFSTQTTSFFLLLWLFAIEHRLISSQTRKYFYKILAEVRKSSALTAAAMTDASRTTARSITSSCAIPDVILINILSYLPIRSHLPICHVSGRFRSMWRDLRTLVHEIERRTTTRIADQNEHDDDDENANEDADDGDDHLYLTDVASNLYDISYTSIKPTLRRDLLRYHLSNGLSRHPSSLNSVLIRAAELGDTDGMSYVVDNDICRITPNIGHKVCTAAAAAGKLDALIYAREMFGCPWDARKAYAEAERGSKVGRDGCHSVLVYIYLNSDDILSGGAGMPV